MIINNHQDPSFIEEDKNLQVLEDKISASVDGIRSEIKSNQQKLKTERDPIVIKQLNNENLQYREDSKIFERCKPKPYFARMSFLVNGKEETYVK